MGQCLRCADRAIARPETGDDDSTATELDELSTIQWILHRGHLRRSGIRE